MLSLNMQINIAGRLDWFWSGPAAFHTFARLFSWQALLVVDLTRTIRIASERRAAGSPSFVADLKRVLHLLPTRDHTFALKEAARLGLVGVVRVLLPGSTRNANNWALLDAASAGHRSRTLRCATEDHFLAVIRSLIPHCDVGDSDALHRAVEVGRLDLAEELLPHCDGPPVLRAFRRAVCLGSLPFVRLLLPRLGPEEKRSSEPLELAAEEGHRDVVAELVAHFDAGVAAQGIAGNGDTIGLEILLPFVEDEGALWDALEIAVEERCVRNAQDILRVLARYTRF